VHADDPLSNLHHEFVACLRDACVAVRGNDRAPG